MRVTVHWELMENCINNGNFAKNTSASAYDTLSEIEVKTDWEKNLDHLMGEK